MVFFDQLLEWASLVFKREVLLLFVWLSYISMMNWKQLQLYFYCILFKTKQTVFFAILWYYSSQNMLLLFTILVVYNLTKSVRRLFLRFTSITNLFSLDFLSNPLHLFSKHKECRPTSWYSNLVSWETLDWQLGQSDSVENSVTFLFGGSSHPSWWQDYWRRQGNHHQYLPN